MAQVNEPEGIALDSPGNICIADYGNSKIRKIDTSGIINTIAGTGSTGYSGDGGPATAASLNLPTGVAVDSSGNVYIVDNQNGRVRKVDATGVITTIVSTSTSGITTLFFREDVAVDAHGHVLIADYNNMRVIKL